MQWQGFCFYYPCKTSSMQNTLIPTSFLSAALTNETTMLKAENHLYIIREERTTEKISRLYRLFFGANKTNVAVVAKAEHTQPEPDYYSSYE